MFARRIQIGFGLYSSRFWPETIAVGFNRNAVARAVALAIGIWVVPPATARPAALAAPQADAQRAYDEARENFAQVLAQRRAQIDAKQPLPSRPGQALYLARNAMISAAKDFTDAVPSRIGGPNKFGIPPAYFDAGMAPLLDAYRKLFDVLEAPPAGAQASETPFKDVVDLGTAIARAKGLDAANAEVAGLISLGMFFAETNGNQNVGNGRSNTYKGSFQTGTAEDAKGRRNWAAIKPRVAAIDPAANARDDKEEARAGAMDHRYNHWTAVRDGLMNVHADLFPQVPAIVRTLPDPIDQMKLFELFQIVPAPAASAMRSGDLLRYRVSDRRIMGLLRNNSIFAFGRADRAKTSANFREILDAMWLFNAKFERALSIYNEIKAGRKA